MRSAIVAMVLFMLTLPAEAQTLAEKQCTFALAQKLPNIVGLSIAASRTKDVPKDTKEAGGITGPAAMAPESAPKTSALPLRSKPIASRRHID
jgi:hypothetical protein